MQIPPEPAAADNVTPPLLPTWKAWYLVVLGALGAELALFLAITRYFA